MTRLATFFPKFPICSRCHKEILAKPTYYDGKVWYHLACWEEGEQELQEAQARADKLVRRFGFATLPIPGE